MAWLARLSVLLIIFQQTAVSFGEEFKLEPDDVLLWRAASAEYFYHNRVRVSPPTPDELSAVVKRYPKQSANQRRAQLADVVDARAGDRLALAMAQSREEKIRKGLPNAWRGELAGALTKGLLKGMIAYEIGPARTYQEEESNQDLSDGIDSFFKKHGDSGLERSLKTLQDISLLKTVVITEANLRDVSISEQIESYYRGALGEKRLVADEFFVDECEDHVGTPMKPPGGPRSPLMARLARVSYRGSRPLTHVMVVTHSEMKAMKDGENVKAAFDNHFKEMERRGMKGNVSDLATRADEIGRAAPQASCAYVSVLEPGDVIHVPIRTNGSLSNLVKSSISIYSGQGALIDHVTMVGGRDASSLPKPPPSAKPAKPVGPKYNYSKMNRQIELKLRPAEDESAPSPFEMCIPSGDSFVSLGTKVTLDRSQTWESIAMGPKHYVVLGPDRKVGKTLVMVPTNLVAKRTEIDNRPPEQKAFEEQQEMSKKGRRYQPRVRQPMRRPAPNTKNSGPNAKKPGPNPIGKNKGNDNEKDSK